MHDVFISYSSEDKNTADAVCAGLEAKGIRCWIAPRDIPPGAEWMSAIIEAVAASRIMILVFSAHSNRSQQVVSEVHAAFEEDVTIIPFKIADDAMRPEMKYMLSSRHWMEALTPPIKKHIAALAEHVATILDRKIDPIDSESGEEQKSTSIRRGRLVIAASLAILAMIAVIGFPHFPRTDDTRDVSPPIDPVAHPQSQQMTENRTQGGSNKDTTQPGRGEPARQPSTQKPPETIGVLDRSPLPSLEGTTWKKDGKEATLTLPNGSDMEFVLIPSGSFKMGSPPGETGRNQDEQQHEVKITNPFWLGKYEVTQRQWKTVMGDNPSKFSGDDQRPVELVSWNDCQGFIRALNKVGDGRFRLPTEAEWEYACRADSQTPFYFGNSAEQLGDYAIFDNKSVITTYPVGIKQPNAWQLYDMMGNVAEWCGDWYGDYVGGGNTNPAGRLSGSYRVIRGGGFTARDDWCRSARRSTLSHMASGDDVRANYVGFRVLREESFEDERGRSFTPQRDPSSAPLISLEGTEWEEHGATAVLTLPSGVTVDFVRIPPNFNASNDAATQTPPPGGPFWMGKYEVTQAQWMAVAEENPSLFRGEEVPVNSTTWFDCDRYCQRLNGIGVGRFFLPSMQQWETAAQAGATGAYCFGSDVSLLGACAWYDDNSDGRPHAVGQKRPNAWGLHDLHGNVWEWCSGPCGYSSSSQGLRPVKGGSWQDDAKACRASGYSKCTAPFCTSVSYGFRLCRAVSDVSSPAETKPHEAGGL